MKKLSCIIVDDDEIDQLMVIAFVKRFSHLELLGTFFNAADALVFCNHNSIDILFLDIDMPEINGLELRKHLLRIPVCVFISAHPEHALDSFELDTLDFVVKPLKFDRFSKTIDRINDYMELKTKAGLFESNIGGDTVFIKEGNQQIKIKLHEILYLEALKDYTLLVTENKKHCVLASLGNLLKENNFLSFIRIHRSYAIPQHGIVKIGSNEIILHNNITIPVGRKYKSNLNSHL